MEEEIVDSFINYVWNYVRIIFSYYLENISYSKVSMDAENTSIANGLITGM